MSFKEDVVLPSVRGHEFNLALDLAYVLAHGKLPATVEAVTPEFKVTLVEVAQLASYRRAVEVGVRRAMKRGLRQFDFPEPRR